MTTAIAKAARRAIDATIQQHGQEVWLGEGYAPDATLIEKLVEALSSSASSSAKCQCGQFAVPSDVTKIEARDYSVHARHACSWGERKSASSETQEERPDVAAMKALLAEIADYGVPRFNQRIRELLGSPQ